MIGLEYELRELIKNSDDSANILLRNESHSGLESALVKTARELHKMGYRRTNATQLQQKHVRALIELWVKKEYKAPTIYARLAAIRWWASQVGRESAIAKSNKAYRLEETAEALKAMSGNFHDKLDIITDPHVRMSLKLQSVFGLSARESIKFIPAQADDGHTLNIKNTWRGKNAKRGRVVRCELPEQRAILDEAKALAGTAGASMIPANRTYIEQQNVYERHLARAGFSLIIGALNEYIVWRYWVLTGENCPAKGGQLEGENGPDFGVKFNRAAREIDKEVEGLSASLVRSILRGSARA